MDVQQEEHHPPVCMDPIVAILKRNRLRPTVKNYLEASYPGQEVEDLKGDAEVMQRVNETLGLEESSG